MCASTGKHVSTRKCLTIWVLSYNEIVLSNEKKNKLMKTIMIFMNNFKSHMSEGVKSLV